MNRWALLLLFVTPVIFAAKPQKPPLPLLTCEGKLKDDLTYKLVIPSNDVTHLELNYFGTKHKCLLTLQSLDRGRSPTMNDYVFEIDRGLHCRPKLSSELHHGLEDHIDLRVRNSKKKGLTGEIALFEGYKAIACQKVTLRKKEFEVYARLVPQRSLRAPTSTRPGKPLGKIGDYIK